MASPVARDAECPTCHRDARVCRNCRHYDTAAFHECREAVPDAIVDKERRNFCDLFSFRLAKGRLEQDDRDRKAKAQFENLFRSDPGE